MKYFFGHKLNVLPSTATTSEEVQIKVTKDTATLSVSNGAVFLLNSIVAGQTIQVTTGDKVRVRATSPAVLEHTDFYEVKQDSELVGIYTLSSQQEPALVRDERYEGVPLYKTLPEEDWELTAPIKIGMNVDGTYSELGIEITPLNNIPVDRIHVVDYHRHFLHVLDAEGNYFGSVAIDNYPVSEQTLHASGIRVGTVVLFENNTAKYFDNFYNENQTINIGAHSNTLNDFTNGFITYANNVVSMYTLPNFTKTTLTVPDNISCLAYSLDDDILYVACGTNLYVYVDSVLEDTIELPEVPFSINYGDDNLHIAYGNSGKFSILEPYSQTFTNLYLGGCLTYASKNINSDDVWISDFDKHLMYKYARGKDLEVFQMSGVPIGIVASLNNAFSPILYDNLPARFTLDDREPDVVTLPPLQSELNAPVSMQVTLTGFTGQIEVSSPNGTHSITPSVTDVTEDGEFTLTFTAREMFYDALELPIVYGDKVAYFTVLPPDIEPIPDNFYFWPKYNLEFDTEVTSDALEIMGLIGEGTAEIDVTDGIFILNDVITSTPTTITNGDVIRVRRQTASTFSTTELVKVSIENLDIYFAVTTKSNRLFSGHNFTVDSNLYESINSPVESNSVIINLSEPYDGQATVSIPDVYNASIFAGGEDKGLSFTFDNNHAQPATFKSNTGEYPGKYYPLPIIGQDYSTLWLIRTKPVLKVHNFTFGEHDSDHMKTVVESLEVVVSGIPENEFVKLYIPIGLKAYVNGNLTSAPRDYYGFSSVPAVYNVKLGDVIKLEALPSSVYGEQQVYTVTIDNTEGTFKINTPDSTGMVWDDDHTEGLDLHEASLSTGDQLAFYPLDSADTSSLNSLTLTSTLVISQEIISLYSTKPLLSAKLSSDQHILVSQTPIDTINISSTMLVSNVVVGDVSVSNVLLTDTRYFSVVNYTNTVLDTDTLVLPMTIPNIYLPNVPTGDSVISYNANQILSETMELPLAEIAPKGIVNNFELLFGTDVLGQELYGKHVGDAGALRSPVQVYDVQTPEYLVYSTFEIEYENGNFKFLDSHTDYGDDLHVDNVFTIEETPIEVIYNQGNIIYSTYDVTEIGYFNVSIEDLYNVHKVDFFGVDIVRYDIQPVGTLTAELATAKYNDYEPMMDAVILESFSHQFNPEVNYRVEVLNVVYADKFSAYASADQGKLAVDDNFIRTVQATIDPSSSYYVVFPELSVPSISIDGYFDTSTQAQAEAESEGYVSGEYIITEIPNKGFIWVVPMKCVNTCYGKCPPEGYVKGG